MTTTQTKPSVARVRLLEATPDRVIVGPPGTNYRLYLQPTGPVRGEVGDRIRGVIRCNVWKLDEVSAGGAYVEPVFGRPRRVQGKVIATLPESNAVVVDLWDTPIVGLLPERWPAADIPLGIRVGLDVKAGSTFEPIADSQR